MSIIKRSIHSNDLPNPEKATIQTWDEPLFKKAGVSVDVLRLDKIHTIVSGNKWFKLKYYLEELLLESKKGIMTLGGPYSNHLLATAFVCKQSGLSSIGIVRGGEPQAYSNTLKDAQSYGMQLQFVSRRQYIDDEFIERVRHSYPDFLFVEEGGRGKPGVKGAEEILHLTAQDHHTHVICAVGTGTMMAGIINSSDPAQLIVGIPVIKLGNYNANSISEFISNNGNSKNFLLKYDYHFGGYGKRSTELIRFMNYLYDGHRIPTDFVYTGKLFYATMNLIESGFFELGSKILLIHSGGLQGNRSLISGTLHFSY